MKNSNFKYIVYGLGISGIATAKFLTSQNFKVIATDDDPNTVEKFKKNSSLNLANLQVLKPDEISFDEESIISFSPGIPLYYPKPHKILDICKQTNAKLKCDIEIFYDLNYHQNNFIGITGTNGKSTTTALTGFIFEQLEINSAIGGNIGVACFDLPQDTQNFYYIFETSSYQLDLISNCKFNIACLTNITIDHIDRHGTFENYIQSKMRIFQNQTKDDYAIICVDNQHSKNVYHKLLNDKHPAFMIATSVNTILENGISVVKNEIFINLKNQHYNLKINPKIKGQHNQENISIALSTIVAYLIKTHQLNQKNLEKIVDIINKFGGLRHRLQNIRSVNNINFINDSKATNAESTLHALKSYDNIYWILGGKAKEGGISILKPYFSKIIKAYLIGESANDFAYFLKQNNVDFEISNTLEIAFKSSYQDALKNNSTEINIILSPACASFDQWKNFEARGDFFYKLVNEI